MEGKRDRKTGKILPLILLRPALQSPPHNVGLQVRQTGGAGDAALPIRQPESQCRHRVYIHAIAHGDIHRPYPLVGAEGPPQHRAVLDDVAVTARRRLRLGEGGTLHPKVVLGEAGGGGIQVEGGVGGQPHPSGVEDAVAVKEIQLRQRGQPLRGLQHKRQLPKGQTPRAVGDGHRPCRMPLLHNLPRFTVDHHNAAHRPLRLSFLPVGDIHPCRSADRPSGERAALNRQRGELALNGDALRLCQIGESLGGQQFHLAPLPRRSDNPFPLRHSALPLAVPTDSPGR